MEGYLKKWVNLIYRWQNRYFIIHEDSLIYCQQQGAPKKGIVHLSICSIRAVPNDPLRIVINYGMNELHIRGQSVQEKEKWLDALLEAQQKVQMQSIRKPILNQNRYNPFHNLEGVPKIDLEKIHSSLTQIWVLQADLEAQISMTKGNQQLSKLLAEIKDQITDCAKSLDDEYNHMVILNEKLQEKVRDNNDQNPPDHEDLDDEIINDQFLSFKEDDDFDDFCSVIHGECYDERQIVKRMSVRQPSIGSKSVFQIMETLKLQQPIKYNNVINNEAFKDMLLTFEEFRSQLPSFKDPNEKIRLFSVIKDMVGKDLSKITFPITFNEPLSLLQNLCEQFEYSELLDQANKQQDSCMRLAYVMIWAVSSLSSTIGRIKKPINPILGETYEFSNSKFRFIAEQVSHHPPISVGYADNQNFEVQTDNNMKTQFWGKSIEITPQGTQVVKLKQYNDKITFQRCKFAIKNLIIGQQYCDHFGEMTFKNETTGDFGILKLTERGWNGGGAFQVNGAIKDKQDQQIQIKGQWDSSISITYQNQTKLIWKKNDLPVKYEYQYCFTNFAIQLNHLNQQLLKQLPPSDSRLRPDQRALENSNIEFATIEKTRLEQKQRNARKELQEKHLEYIPRWFTPNYQFKGDYWKLKENPQFHIDALDIF